MEAHICKKPYVVYIQEYYHKSVVVWAEDETEAATIADGLCDCGEINLERNCYAGRDIDVQGQVDASILHEFDEYG